MFPTIRNSGRWFLLFGFLFLAQTIPHLWMDSLTNDEAWEITNGYCYWKQGDVRTPVNHPPLACALQAVPLFFMGLDSTLPPIPGANHRIEDYFVFNENRAYDFFYVRNPGKIGQMAFGARAVSVLFGLGIGFLIFFVARGLDGPVFFSALVLWCFEPTLLSSSTLAKTDIPAVFFFFLALLVFQKASPRRKSGLFLAGCAAGLAACSKLSNLSLLPACLVLDLWDRRPSSSRKPGPWLERWFFFSLGFLSVVAVIFIPGTFFLPEHWSPFHYFFLKLGDIVWYSRQKLPNFFLGRCTFQNHPSYFPIAFILKTTFPFLLFFFAGIWAFLSRKVKWPAWLWFPSLVFLAGIQKAPDLGIRYLLPVFPFFILWAADGASWIWKLSKPGTFPLSKAVVSLLLAWHAATLCVHFRDHISYFDDFVPQSRKMHLLGDYNLDIGQDHKRLVQTARDRGWKRVKLAYEGVTDPYFYGLKWEPWTQADLKGPQPGYTYLVDIAFLQSAPMAYPGTLPIVESWIRTARPSGRVGDTWLYFEFEGSPPKKDRSPALDSVPYFVYHNPSMGM